jgi:hypothetical protein
MSWDLTAPPGSAVHSGFPSQTNIPSAIFHRLENTRPLLFRPKWWPGDWVEGWTSLFRDGRPKGRQLVFWLTCVIVLAGCWLWSATRARRRGPPRVPGRRPWRQREPFVGAVTSSEDEDGEPQKTWEKAMAEAAEGDSSGCSPLPPRSASGSYSPAHHHLRSTGPSPPIWTLT